MLGRLRRTTRRDVGLSLTFTGLVFLTWSFVTFTARHLIVRLMMQLDMDGSKTLPEPTRLVNQFFSSYGFVIDLTGLAWMLLSLTLVLLASRQKISISWSWLSSGIQILVASLGSIFVHVATAAPYDVMISQMDNTLGEKISLISWPTVLCIAVLSWVYFLIRLLLDRGKFDKTQPTLNDSFRSNQ